MPENIPKPSVLPVPNRFQYAANFSPMPIDYFIIIMVQLLYSMFQDCNEYVCLCPFYLAEDGVSRWDFHV